MTKAKASPEDPIARWNDGLYKLTISQAAAKLGLERRALGKMLKRAASRGVEVKGRDIAKPAAGKPGFTVKDFSSLYNKSERVPKKIKERLASLGDEWRYEADFAREAGVSLPDLAQFRAQFEENIVATRRDGGGRVWARASVARTLREMVS